MNTSKCLCIIYFISFTATARSIGDIGFASPSSSAFFPHNENEAIPASKQSQSKPTSDTLNDTEKNNNGGGVKWQDQTVTSSSPEVATSPSKHRNGHVIPSIREDPDESGQEVRT